MMGDESVVPYREEIEAKYHGFVRLFKLLARFNRVKSNHPDLVKSFTMDAFVSNAGKYSLRVVNGGTTLSITTDADDKNYDTVRQIVFSLEERAAAASEHARMINSIRNRMPSEFKNLLKPPQGPAPFNLWVNNNLDEAHRNALYREYPHLLQGNI